MRKVKFIFFDLDHTLWDYDANSEETLTDIFDLHSLKACGIPDFDSFHRRFVKVNDWLWSLYDFGKIGGEAIRNDRFVHVLKGFKITDEHLAATMSEYYMKECPRKAKLMPHVHETLGYLSERYPLSVVTNGFEETQHIKLRASGLTGYFKHVITSQRAGHKKPAREIFELALTLNRGDARDGVMVGDNLATDITGARNSKLGSIFYNPVKRKHKETVDLEIEHMSELHAHF